MIKIVSTCFQNAHTKLVTLYRNSSYMDVIFDFVLTLFLHDCSINEDCKCHFIADLGNAWNLRDVKAKERRMQHGFSFNLLFLSKDFVLMAPRSWMFSCFVFQNYLLLNKGHCWRNGALLGNPTTYLEVFGRSPHYKKTWVKMARCHFGHFGQLRLSLIWVLSCSAFQ